MKESLPRAGRWHKEFAKEGKVVLLGVHTVFEIHDAQTPDKLKEFLKKQQIPFPVGVDKSKEGDKIPITMRKYQTGGTPCTAVIDKKGVLRFKKFGNINETEVKSLIRQLTEEK